MRGILLLTRPPLGVTHSSSFSDRKSHYMQAYVEKTYNFEDCVIMTVSIF